MGGPMAANLVAAGHTVRGFDPVAALRGGRGSQGRHGVRQRRRGRRRRRRGDHLAAQRRHRQARATPRCCPPPRPARCSSTRSTISVDDARDIHEHAVERGLRPTRRAGVRRRQGRDRGHAGVHGRRRGRRRRARPAGAGTDGGQGHSLRRVRRGPGRQAVQQHGARRAADRRRRGVRARREARACPRSRCST